MENNKLDTYAIDVKASIMKVKYLIIGCVAFSILSLLSSSIIAIICYNKAMTNIRIIDRKGFDYTSEIINPTLATDLQTRNFIRTYVQLCYSFDANNIEERVNRALKLGDASVAGYIQIHSAPNEIYHAVKGLGRKAIVNEAHILDNLSLGNGSFKTIFVQSIQDGLSTTNYKITISGNINVISSDNVDNPCGLYITNFVENYEKL